MKTEYTELSVEQSFRPGDKISAIVRLSEDSKTLLGEQGAGRLISQKPLVIKEIRPYAILAENVNGGQILMATSRFGFVRINGTPTRIKHNPEIRYSENKYRH